MKASHILPAGRRLPEEGCYAIISMQNFPGSPAKEDLFGKAVMLGPAGTPSTSADGMLDPAGVLVMVDPDASFQILVVSDESRDRGGELASRIGRGMLKELRLLAEGQS